jgi:hypothetical protein
MADGFEPGHQGWTSPPGAPIRYGPIDRLADVYHGRRDGRKGIPHVTIPPPAEPEDDITGPRHAAPEPGAEHVGTEHVGTPQLMKLRALARDLTTQERIAWFADIEPIRSQLTQIYADIQTLADQTQGTELLLEKASKKPGDEDLKERRSAESDPEKRSDRLVRERRLAEFAKRQAEAEEAHLAAVARLALAHQEARVREGAMDRREAVARTRAHRIYEHAWRRTATYWQQLIRVHPHGPHLNARLQPTGPELPRWAREEPDAPEGAGTKPGFDPEAGTPQASNGQSSLKEASDGMVAPASQSAASLTRRQQPSS